MTKSKKFKKIGKLCLSFALGLLTIGAGIISAPKFDDYTRTYAEEGGTWQVKNFDETKIEDDLKGFDLSQYADEDTVQLVTMQEFTFSEETVLYGQGLELYFYIYNPTGMKIRDYANQFVSMASKYVKGEPQNYQKMQLSILDCTDDYKFYKAKLSYPSLLEREVRAYNQGYGERRYDISGFELILEEADGQARPIKEYSIEKTYYFSGYSKGLNNNEESTLTSRVEGLETLGLDCYHTYYRPQISGDVESVDQLHSVYFTVPNELLDEYGALYGISAEYLGATLNWSLVTGNQNAFLALENYLGVDTTYNDNGKLDGLDYAFLADLEKMAGVPYQLNADFTYNVEIDGYPNFTVKTPTDGETRGKLESTLYLRSLYLLFGTGTFTEDSADNYIVSSKELRDNMALSAVKGYADKTALLTSIDGKTKYASEIFESYDTEMQPLKATAEDTFDLTATTEQKSFWDYIFGRDGENEVNTVFREKPVIQEITSTDFAYSSIENICKNLLISEADYTHFKQVYDEAQAEEETLFLYRYRVSDYKVKEATCFRRGSYDILGFIEQDTNAYFFKEDIDLFFDIIDVTCRKDGVDTVISVVMDPLEFIPEATPPTDTETDKPLIPDIDDIKDKGSEWFKNLFVGDYYGLSVLSWVLICILAYLLLCVVGKITYPLVPFILSGVFGAFYIITLPFRLIVLLIKMIKGDDK